MASTKKYRNTGKSRDIGNSQVSEGSLFHGRSATSGSFRYTGKETEIDKKRRVNLGQGVPEPPEGVRYQVWTNDAGQILLDPVKSVPIYEAWIYENPERIASIQRGIAQAEAGELVTIDLGPDKDE